MAPQGLRTAIEHPQIGNPFAHEPKRDRYSALAAAYDDDIMDVDAVLAAGTTHGRVGYPRQSSSNRTRSSSSARPEASFVIVAMTLPRPRPDPPLDRKRLMRHRLGEGNDVGLEPAGERAGLARGCGKPCDAIGHAAAQAGCVNSNHLPIANFELAAHHHVSYRSRNRQVTN